MSLGTLYGVGAGPGAPDLLTLRAARLLREVPVLAFPKSSPYSPSMAWRIVAPTVGERPEQERLFLPFPMVHDPERLVRAWDHAICEIGTRLEQGLSVAFVTEGDPSLYSTFIYLLREARSRWPQLTIEVVPGVSSVTAVPAVTQTPIADGQERIAIVPAAYGVDDLPELLSAFDTVVLMKIGPAMPAVIAAIEAAGLSDRAVYVSRATQSGQRIVRDLHRVEDQRGDCFAMIVVTKQLHSGLLAGQVPWARPGAPAAQRPRVSSASEEGV
jgi:precorrin-2/cobalt-factor-2 C20-methyltransferase